MADFAGTMKEAAFATSPREFDLSYSTTLEEIFDKLNARRTAFQMPFQIKGGVAGQRIVFEKEPNLDVTLWLYLSNGTHIRIRYRRSSTASRSRITFRPQFPSVRSRRRAGLPRCCSASSAAGSASTASMSARSAPAYCSCLPPGFSASE